MAPVFLPDLRLNAELSGPSTGAPLVLLHGLGADLSIWDEVVSQLPDYRILRLDLRGHGQSDAPQGPYSMGAMIRDVERLIEHFGLKDTVVIGCALGGLIAQGLATKRLDLVRALVLSNTAARIGFSSQWQQQIAAVETGGLAAISQELLSRWLGRKWLESPVLPRLRATLLATPPQGWCGAAAAMAGTDFYTPTAALTLPALVIAGYNDAITPPDLVRETAELMRGHRFALMRDVGHLPMVEAPAAFVALVETFLTSIGHGGPDL